MCHGVPREHGRRKRRVERCLTRYHVHRATHCPVQVSAEMRHLVARQLASIHREIRHAAVQGPAAVVIGCPVYVAILERQVINLHVREGFDVEEPTIARRRGIKPNAVTVAVDDEIHRSRDRERARRPAPSRQRDVRLQLDGRVAVQVARNVCFVVRVHHGWRRRRRRREIRRKVRDQTEVVVVRARARRQRARCADAVRAAVLGGK